MKPISIQGCQRLISPLIIGPHCVSKAHDDKDFDDFVESGGNCFYMHSAVWEGYTPFDASMRGLITQKQLPVLAWTSDFNQSFFIPREINRDSVPKDRRLNRWYTDENFAIREKAAALGAKYNLNVRQINVAYLLNQDFPTAVMCYQDHDLSAQEYFAAINSAIRKQELEELRPKNLT